jgi:hypothetical protein
MKNRDIITKKDLEKLRDLQKSSTLSKDVVLPAVDDFLDRLMKYVPLEILGGYSICEGVIRSFVKDGLMLSLLILFILGIVGTYFYVKKYLNVTRYLQVYIAVLGFVIWVFSIGGWFGEFNFWKAGYGTIGVIIFAITVKILKLPSLPNPATLIIQNSSKNETAHLD